MSKKTLTEEAIKLAKAYAKIREAVTFYETRDDAGIIDDNDVNYIKSRVKLVEAFRKEYGNQFVDKYFSDVSELEELVED